MRPPPPSSHSNFFSSLKQVEKRLKLEQSQSQSQTQPPESNNLLTDSLCSPIHININHHYNNEILPNFTDSSEPPQAFLSCSPQFPQTNENQVQSNTPSLRKPIAETNSIDDIDHLIQLLGLSEGLKEESSCLGISCGSCHCEGGFYSKIAGVRGPKCDRELERLKGWIKHFLNGDQNGKKIEPLRLSLLLLGKAAFASQGEDGDFGGLDFPSAVEDFLIYEPPTETAATTTTIT